jgi:geranylgeranyl reductase family protein
MQPEYDILIAGAGPAGCAAAYDLARAGKRVLLLDRRSFPRHKACACGLTRKTLKALRYSVDPIVERVCHEIVLQQTSSDPKLRQVRVKNRTPIAAMAVRERFDKFCLDQTLAAGRNGGSATLLKIEAITALREAGSPGSALPTHIELDITTADGPQTLRAPVLIGADGSNGQTRRLTGTLTMHDGFALEATVPYTALPATLPGGDAPHDLVFDFAPLPGGYGWLFPKGDHINIGVGAFAPSDATASTDLKQVTRALLNQYSEQKLGIAQLDHITGQHLGMGGHDYVPRGRVLLVGDAAGLVDPLTGEGIHSAIVSGQAAAAAILEVLRQAPALGSETSTLDPASLAAAYARNLQPRRPRVLQGARPRLQGHAHPAAAFADPQNLRRRPAPHTPAHRARPAGLRTEERG